MGHGAEVGFLGHGVKVVKPSIEKSLGPVWFRYSLFFKTHNLNPKLITPYSNLTSLKNCRTLV